MFGHRLLKEISKSTKNNFTDNYDEIRFGKMPKAKQLVEKNVHQKLLKKDFVKLRLGVFDEIMERFDAFEGLYALLNDQASKDLLVKLLAYRAMGHKKVKLPLSQADYWEQLESIEKHAQKQETIDPGHLHFKLYKYNLEALGFPLQFFHTSKGIFTDFVLKQYEYINNGVHLKAKEGDYVIDAGGCWGDTALYFASQVGNQGKVFVYEFIPSNLKILHQNIALNPQYDKVIDVVANPVWENSKMETYYLDNGPGSKVSFEASAGMQDKVETLSIDDLVKQKNMERVDFIKMDIEGAEPFALKGAINTLKKFRPTLAIAIYHSLSDMANIPNWINDLGLGYNFYLGHYTIHQEETILFAVPK